MSHRISTDQALELFADHDLIGLGEALAVACDAPACIISLNGALLPLHANFAPDQGAQCTQCADQTPMDGHRHGPAIGWHQGGN